MTRYICIHGHFYQPPRENPKTGIIDVQPSASPFPNWNYRIAKECYLANGQAKILNEEGDTVALYNNYSQISFNFGPTLLRWMEDHTPEVNRRLVAADKRSIELLGHGSAMAQVYHHAILPLCNAQDKYTEVVWGMADFRHRFGRAPTGMWLAETAADIPSLEALAAAGIEWTILAPGQAKAVRRLGETNWQATNSVDTSRPYWIPLPSGKRIAVFFYDGPLASEVAFRGALNNGEAFANRMIDVARKHPEGSILHYATDGESYGHHHRYGEMALAYCLKTIGECKEVEVTNYAAYLAKFPPTFEAQIHEPSAWSCSHGVGRWSENCGCVIDPAMAGKQQWRRHLRDALNWLRDRLAEHFESFAGQLVRSPWELRHGWMEAELEGRCDAFLDECRTIDLSVEQRQKLHDALHVQRHALMMFTSCGWFFDDCIGLEATQILRYAWHAIRLHHTSFGVDYEAGFVEQLRPMTSANGEYVDGQKIWEQLVTAC